MDPMGYGIRKETMWNIQIEVTSSLFAYHKPQNRGLQFHYGLWYANNELVTGANLFTNLWYIGA